MKKMTLSVLVSVSLLAAFSTAGAAEMANTSYIVDSSGNAVKGSSGCVVSSSQNNSAIEGCDVAMAAKAPAAAAMEKPAMAEKAPAAPAPMAKKQHYVVDSNGNAVKIGSNCIVATSPNKNPVEGCGDAMMAKPEAPKVAPKPKVITKVIVDCTRCPK